MPIVQSRRRFLTNAAAFAGTAGLAGVGAAGLGDKEKSLAAEPPPETNEIRFENIPIYCEAPRYIAEELLRAEGFTVRDVEHAATPRGTMLALAHGEYDFAFLFAPDAIVWLDAGIPFTILAGVHPGCFELFGNEQIRSIADLKNRTVGVGTAGLLTELVTIMTTYLGLDPSKDIHWITDPSIMPMELFLAGKIDAFLAVPPEPQELRARKIGHVLVSSAVDRPWSQYFCCMLTGNAEFVRKHPVVTKHVVRAVCKGADLCASEPMRVAQVMVDRGYGYDHVVQTLTDVPYNGAWRDYEPDDTLRFYALRLREAGFIKSIPQKIIAEGSDWRFLNEVKRELKT
jgi:NitT/TauT family transport system substrate-binding protein